MQPVGRHRSPGLTAIFNAIKKNSRNQVLDLGASVASNFKFFSQLGCHFHFENFAEIIQDHFQGSEADQQGWEERFLKYLRPEQTFDVVLVWDLFNFIPIKDQARIYTKLKKYIKPNTLFFMLTYVGANRPATPGSFKIHDQYYIEVTTASASVPNATKMTTLQLLKSLPKYQMLRSYLNMDGMMGGLSEQILCYAPQREHSNSVFSNAELSQQVKVNAEFRSPALEQLRLVSQTQETLRVLDLGGKNVQNEQHLKSHFQEVFTVDFRQVLQRLPTMDRTAQINYLKSGSYFGFNSSQKFDVIIAWDFLNYFDDELLAALGERLEMLAKDSSLLMSINYTSDAIPIAPRQYAITAKGVGFNDQLNAGLKNREWPLLNSLKVQKCLPGFFIKHTYTVQQGMQRGTSEYLLVYKDGSTQQKEKAALYEQVMERRRLREQQQPQQETVEV